MTLSVSCFSKIQIGFTILVSDSRLTQVVSDKGLLNRCCYNTPGEILLLKNCRVQESSEVWVNNTRAVSLSLSVDTHTYLTRRGTTSPGELWEVVGLQQRHQRLLPVFLQSHTHHHCALPTTTSSRLPAYFHSISWTDGPLNFNSLCVYCSWP